MIYDTVSCLGPYLMWVCVCPRSISAPLQVELSNSSRKIWRKKRCCNLLDLPAAFDKVDHVPCFCAEIHMDSRCTRRIYGLSRVSCIHRWHTDLHVNASCPRRLSSAKTECLRALTTWHHGCLATGSYIWELPRWRFCNANQVGGSIRCFRCHVLVVNSSHSSASYVNVTSISMSITSASTQPLNSCPFYRISTCPNMSTSQTTIKIAFLIWS